MHIHYVLINRGNKRSGLLNHRLNGGVDMTNLEEMLRQEEYGKIWDKYCGFLDLNLNEFMHIQERLLMEPILFLLCE